MGRRNKADRDVLQQKLKNPIQPLYLDENGTLRFKSNAIVEYLVESGKADLNEIACMDFNEEDRQQFSQLHGYSLGGFGELSSTTDEVYYAAERMYENPELKSLQARYDVLEKQLHDIQQLMREGVAKLYGAHPDDICEKEEES